MKTVKNIVFLGKRTEDNSADEREGARSARGRQYPQRERPECVNAVPTKHPKHAQTTLVYDDGPERGSKMSYYNY